VVLQTQRHGAQRLLVERVAVYPAEVSGNALD